MTDEQIHAICVLMVAGSGRQTPLTMQAAEDMLRTIITAPNSPFAAMQSGMKKCELNIEIARTEAAKRVVLGTQLGRMAHAAGLPREAMKDEPQRIGWDEAAHGAGVLGTEGGRDAG